MTIERKNPDLYTVLGRRRKTVVEFLEDQNIDTPEALNEWLKSAYGIWQISQTFLEEANLFVSPPVKETIKESNRVFEDAVKSDTEETEEEKAQPSTRTKKHKQIDS